MGAGGRPRFRPLNEKPGSAVPRYVNDSIVEALCEVVFEPSVPWDPTVFGNFRQRIGDERFPIREAGEVVDLGLAQNDTMLAHQVKRQPRMRFLNPERTRIAQVGVDLVAANVLPPYPHWADFRSFALEVISAYRESASPRKLSRMTLRYLDRVTPTESEQQLGKWLDTNCVYIPSYLGDAGPGSLSRVTRPREDRIESVTAVYEAGDPPTVLLDTELTVEQPSVAVDDNKRIGDLLDVLHERVIEVFEACITEKLRQVLRPIGGTS